jgi:serine/threonine-protein phosphatase 2A regulatory subunit A
MAAPSEAPDPLALLQEDLRDDDIEQVVASASRINLVATSIGPDRTRTQLLAFLREYAEEDNDEAHAAIAKQLGEFVPLIGGPTHGKLLLPILEKFCGEEEVVVREAAVGSLGIIVGQFRKEDLKEYVAMIQRLASSPWFATRVSAAGLVPSAYAAAVDPPMQEDLRRIFKALAGDETPMVRKAAFLRLPEYSNTTKQHFVTDVLPILKKLVQDPADGMRLITIEIIASVADFLPPAQFELYLVPLIEALEDDMSWRVRLALAKKNVKALSSRIS